MYTKTEFKAQIVSDFYDKFFEEVSKYENCSIDTAKKNYDCDGFKKLSDRISGNIVTMVEWKFGGYESIDYFEKEDDNYLIHDSLFERI